MLTEQQRSVLTPREIEECHTNYEEGGTVVVDLTEALADARLRVRDLEASIHQLLSVVEYPANGHNYCRYCTAGTNNNWVHQEGCAYKHRTKAIDAARENARRLLAEAKGETT